MNIFCILGFHNNKKRIRTWNCNCSNCIKNENNLLVRKDIDNVCIKCGYEEFIYSNEVPEAVTYNRKPREVWK